MHVDNLPDARQTDSTPTRDAVLTASLAIWSVAMLCFTWVAGVRLDYVSYLAIWKLVLDGRDPWATFAPKTGISANSYGPLFNVLAYFTHLDRLGPKIVMSAAFLAVNFLLFRRLLKGRPSNTAILAYVLFIPANMLVIGVVPWYGQNDALAAALLGLAVLARFRKQLVPVGVLLGLAILLKFYPLLLVPFFCLDRRRFDLRPLVAAACTAAIGFVLGLAIWGDGIRAAVSTGVDRRPKLLSFLAWWDFHPDFYGHSRIADFMIRRNVFAVLAVCAVVFAGAYLLRLSWIEGSTLSLLSLLLTYKVGHPQLFVPLMFLFVGLLIAGTPRALWLAYCCIPFAVFLSVYELGYAWLTDAYSTELVIARFDAGIYAFAIGVITVVVFLAGSFLKPESLGRDEVDEPRLAVLS